MLELILIIKDSSYDPMFEGTLNQFEDCFFSFKDGSSIEEKLNQVRGWVESHSYSLEIKNASKIQA